jgi:Flp pilus assembly protein TadD
MARPARVRLVLLVAVLLAGAGAAAYFFRSPGRTGPGPEPERAADPAPPDPRVTFDTPFRNVRPGVAYVGDAACAPCHQDVCDTFHRHAMGRSAILPTDPADGVEKFTPDARPEFTALGHEYRVERKGNTLVQTETVRGPDGRPAVVTAAEVVAGIGSGTRGRSYLTARDGSLWQTGVSWFSEKQIWDASPGFAPGRHGHRAVVPMCLFCHVDRVEPVPGTLNRYREPFFGAQTHIGCERCHGPGALHVAQQTDTPGPRTGFDTTIVNPRHLPADLREDVCRQCHFQGAQRVLRRGREPFDYRPGLPLELFLTVFVKHPGLTDYHKSVGQVEQVAVSKCATAGDRFGCTACHDPHKAPAPAEKDAYYRGRCLNCHQEHGCTEALPARQAVGDACTACHMPKAASANIAHTAVTDHRILRRPAPGKGPSDALSPGELPIALLPGHGRHGPGEAEVERDFGIALATLARTQPAGPGVGWEAVQRLRAATDRHPTDAAAWEALALTLSGQGDVTGALQAAEAAVAVAPDRELALSTAASMAVGAGQLDQAGDYARRAIAANPGDPENHLRLAQALTEGGQWAEAEAELRTLLAMSPNHATGRATLGLALHRQGKVREAYAELDRAVAIDPRQGPALRQWFANLTR